jgi:TP901 family phage tail tape measure protein
MASEEELLVLGIETFGAVKSLDEFIKALEDVNESIFRLQKTTVEVNKKGEQFITTTGRLVNSQKDLVITARKVEEGFDQITTKIVENIAANEKSAQQLEENAARAEVAADKQAKAVIEGIDRELEAEKRAERERVKLANAESKADQERQDQLERNLKEEERIRNEAQANQERRGEVQTFRDFAGTNLAAPGAEIQAKQAISPIEKLLFEGKTSAAEIQRIYAQVNQNIFNETTETNKKIESALKQSLLIQRDAHDSYVDARLANEAEITKNIEIETKKRLRADRDSELRAQRIQDENEEVQKARDKIAATAIGPSPTVPLEKGLRESNKHAQALAGTLFTIKRLLVFDIAGRAIANFSQALRQSVTDAGEFTQKIAEITTITTQAELSFSQARDGVLALSKQFGAPGTEVAIGAYEALSNQVVESSQTFDFLQDSLKFAAATVSTSSDAVDILSAAIKSYGLEASDAERVSGILFKGIDLGRFRAEDLANSLGTVTVQANVLGVNLEEVTAALAVLTTQGISPSVALTQLRNVFQKLIRPSVALKELLRDLGFESGQAALQALGLGGFLAVLDERTKGAAGELGELLQDIRAINPAIALTGKGLEQFNSNLNEINSDAGRAFNEAVNKTLNNSGKQLQIELNKVKLLFQETFGRTTLEAIVSISRTVGGLDVIVAALTKTLVAGAIAWAAYGVAALTAVRNTGTGLTGIQSGLRAISIAANTTVGSILAIPAAIASVAFAVTEISKALEETTSNAAEKLKAFQTIDKRKIEQDITQVKKIYNDATEDLSRTVLQANAKTNAALEIFSKLVGNGFERTINSASNALELMAANLKEEISDAESLIKSLETSIENSEKRIATLAKRVREAALEQGITQSQRAANVTIGKNEEAVQVAQNQAQEEADARRDILLKEEKDLQNQLQLIQSDADDPQQQQKLADIQAQLGENSQRLLEIDKELAAEQKSIAEDAADAKIKITAQANQEIFDLNQKQVRDLSEQAQEAFEGGDFSQLLSDIFQKKAEGAPLSAQEITDQFKDISESFEAGIDLTNENLALLDKTIPELQSQFDAASELASKDQTVANIQRRDQAEENLNQALRTRRNLTEELQQKEIEAAEAKRQIEDEAKINLDNLVTKQGELTASLKEQNDLQAEIEKSLKQQEILSNTILEKYKQANQEIKDIATNLKNAGIGGSGEAVQALTSAEGAVTSRDATNKAQIESFENTQKIQENLNAINEAQSESIKFAGEEAIALNRINTQREATLKIAKEIAFEAERAIESARVTGANLGPAFEELKELPEAVNNAFDALAQSTSPEEFQANVAALSEILSRPELKAGLEAGGLDPGQITRDTAKSAKEAQEANDGAAGAVERLDRNLQELAKSSPEAYAAAIQSATELQGINTSFADKVNETNDKFGEIATKTGTEIPEGIIAVNDALNTTASDGLETVLQKMLAIQAAAEATKKAVESIDSNTPTPIPSPIQPHSGGFINHKRNLIYRAFGGTSRGSDRIPAMLTPGEFVINSFNTKRNLDLLRAINNGERNLSHYINPGLSDARANKTTAAASNVNLEFGDININGSNINNSQLANTLIKEIKTKIRRGELRL